MKFLHKIIFFDKKTQLTAPETANKMNLLWIKKGAAQKCVSIIRKHIYINLEAYYIIAVKRVYDRQPVD